MPTELQALVTALVDGDADGAKASVAHGEAGGMEPSQLYSRLFAPAMAAVGELWAAGEISVGQEHIASSIMERLLADNYPRVFVAARASREHVLMACVPGERHVLALRMTGDLLEGSGYRVTFLGADAPLAAILEAAERHQPSAIVLAAEGDYAIAPLAEAIQALTVLLPATPIIVGGEAATKLQRPAGDEPVLIVNDIGDAAECIRAAVATGS